MKTTGKELIKRVLEKWRFPVVVEGESGVLFRYQMSYVQVSHSQNENADAIIINLEGIFTADNEAEVLAALKTCNELTCNLLQVKLYLNSENKLVIASEFFYKNEEDLEDLLNIGLQSVILGKKRFLERYPEIEEEMKLISEIENSTFA